MPWSDEAPENPNVKGMVMKWQYEAGSMKQQEGDMMVGNKRLKDSMSWTECKVQRGYSLYIGEHTLRTRKVLRQIGCSARHFRRNVASPPPLQTGKKPLSLGV